MIAGRVSRRHALIPLIVQGPNGQGNAEFVMDTGYTGFLTMPPKAIATLGLSLTNYTPTTLADGTVTMMAVYDITIYWDGVERSVEVIEADGMPLLGTSLLDQHHVDVDFVEDGLVTIRRSHSQAQNVLVAIEQEH